MQIEQLKLILDAMAGLGSEAKAAFVWWLVMEHVPGMLMFFAFLATAVFVVRFIVNAMKKPAESASLARVDRIYEDARRYWLYEAPGGYEKGGMKSLAKAVHDAAEQLQQAAKRDN